MSQRVALLASYDAMDAALVEHGFPPTSPWWRSELARFLRSGRRRWVIRAGRRAGKSSTMCRVAVLVALWGSWSVPAGDTAVVAFVSVDRDEAGARLHTIAAILRALGVGFDERGGEIELRDRPLVFRIVTCSIRGTVGFTSVAVFGDEMARWESRDSAANPAREVMGTLRPTMATQPTAFEVCSSSPWSQDDYHAELFATGDDEHQLTSFAATWTANPSISQERTHELEPHPATWSREYAAVPGSTVSPAFDAADVAACFGTVARGVRRSGFVAIDASSLRGDAFTYIGGYDTTAGELVVDEVSGWEDADLRATSMQHIVDVVAARARGWGTHTVFGDQREEAALSALFAQHQIALRAYAWTEWSKDEAVTLLRRLMRERKLILCEHARLRREATGLRAHLMPSGRTRYDTGGRDYVSALITLAHAAIEERVIPHQIDTDEYRLVSFTSDHSWGALTVPGWRPGVRGGGASNSKFFTDADGQRKYSMADD